MNAAPNISTLPERTSVLEVQVENLEKKVDELKLEFKEDNKEIKDQLEKMYEASCKQHAELGHQLNAVKRVQDKWAVAVTIIAPIVFWVLNALSKKFLGI